jgi:tRNA pseudouridine55 synthase
MDSAGVILYPKPSGVTSHDVVARVRRRLRDSADGQRLKVGHAGTLDPFATGLLLVLVGRATRAQRFLMDLPKRYRAVARLGWRSDTGDRDGRLEHTGRVPAEIELPTGELLQRPPAYSAVRVGGERAYARARRGEAVAPEPRPVTVYGWRVLRRDDERAELEIECSAGTYMRQLVADLGDAYCEELERTAIGPFVLAAADPERIVPLAEALAFLPGRELGAEEARRAGHGVAVAATAEARTATSQPAAGIRPDPGANAGGPVRLTHAGELVAIAEPRGAELKPTVVFAS